MTAIGDHVTAPARLYRRTVMDPRDNSQRREWHEPEFLHKNDRISGIYIGWRTYRNGAVKWMGDEGSDFIATDTIKVALIVQHERANPVPVLFETMVPA